MQRKGVPTPSPALPTRERTPHPGPPPQGGRERPEVLSTRGREWAEARAELEAARAALRQAPEGIARQAPFDRTLAAGRRCTEIVHDWLADGFELERVERPKMLFSLDVDGVLEDWFGDFSATGITGAAALRLLQLGDVAVVLNTAHCRDAVEQRARQFRLFGGVSAFGGTTLDAVFDREERLVSERAEQQLARLRAALRADPTVVLDSAHDCSVRASRIIDGQPKPITGSEARQLLDRMEIFELTFWVAPHYTDFVDRTIDKGMGIERLRTSFGLGGMPLSAMGDGACDVPMLKLAQQAFIPAATLPTYTPPRRQRLVRSRSLGAQALWEAACQMVPNASLQRDVSEHAHGLDIPDWFPQSLRQLPSTQRRRFSRLAAAFGPHP